MSIVRESVSSLVVSSLSVKMLSVADAGSFFFHWGHNGITDFAISMLETLG